MSISSGETESIISSIADESEEAQIIDEPNLIRVNLKLGTVNDVVLEDAVGKFVIFNRNFASTLKDTSEPSSTFMTTKEENLVCRWIQKKCEYLFLVDKFNKHVILTLRKEYSNVKRIT